MPDIFYVAMLIVCFHGDCTRFESAPYSKNIGVEECQKMLKYTFQTQVGPYYDDIIAVSYTHLTLPTICSV